MRLTLWIALASLVASSPGGAQSKPEATSLSGKPLFRIALPDQQKLEANLAQAEKELAAKPNDPDAIIWVGRRLGYLWRYQDAIAMFSKGVALHPNNPKMYRHRGHRYITVQGLRPRGSRLRQGRRARQRLARRDRARWRSQPYGQAAQHAAFQHLVSLGARPLPEGRLRQSARRLCRMHEGVEQRRCADGDE